MQKRSNFDIYQHLKVPCYYLFAVDKVGRKLCSLCGFYILEPAAI
jgi:hypothetical protein